LSATPPHEEVKRSLLESIGLKVVYHLPLDEAVALGIAAPYKIKIIESFLDDKEKYILAGNKKNRFYTTEMQQYQYLSNQIRRIMFSGKDVPKYLYLNRMRFIYNLRSKHNVATRLLASLPKEDRILIFHKSIPRIDELCAHTFHSKTNDEAYKKFIEGKISRLGVADKVNEGTNIPNVDKALVVQLNSQPRELIQRLGRIVRWREGHQAEFYIMQVLQTQDEKWVAKALQDLDGPVEYINAKNI